MLPVNVVDDANEETFRARDEEVKRKKREEGGSRKEDRNEMKERSGERDRMVSNERRERRSLSCLVEGRGASDEGGEGGSSQ